LGLESYRVEHFGRVADGTGVRAGLPL
jgi:hypothetical protein